MNGWSQSVHKIHKRFAPNCFLYQIFSPSAKICTFSKSDHIIHTHTHKTSEDLHTVYRPKHTVNLKNSQHIPTQTNWNWAQFQKVQLIPYKTRYAFSCSPPGQGSYVHKLSLPLEWSQVTHIPASTTRKSAFYSTFARQLCDDVCLPGWYSAFPAHSQTYKSTSLSFTQTNSQPSHTS